MSDGKVRTFINLRVPMRDGTELATHVYLPNAEGPFPVFFRRTPYEALVKEETAGEWPGRGYAYVSQDVRGRFLSDGEFSLTKDPDDGEDTLNWIAAQPWCDGNIAMYGGSALARAQLAAAMSGHPALKCITPCLIGLAPYNGSYWGGAYRLMNKESKSLPLIEPETLVKSPDHALNHPHNDSYWKAISLVDKFHKVKAPAFIRTGWFDLFVCDVFDLYNGLRKNGGTEDVRNYTRIIVGPWPHNINEKDVGEGDFGPTAAIRDLYEQEIAFIDYFTRGKTGYDLNAAPIRIFVMGVNRWRDEYEWPLAGTVWTYTYLSSAGNANTSAGDGKLSSKPSGPADSFSYDPADPVPTRGGAWGFDNVGPYDQTEIEKRPDVLVYTSDKLSDDLEVTGPIKVKLFASSSAVDTDFTAKLVDLMPDGRAMSVTDGIVRARYRNQNGREEFLVPGKVYEFTIKCNPTAYVFLKGHKMRLEISSSNFPAFARNLNTGEKIGTSADMTVARQRVFHSVKHPSRIILPVIPNK